MTKGLMIETRTDTTEGLDTLMSLLYYSRMRFITNLLPLLLASQLPAHVISVYAAGKEGKLAPADLSLRDPKHYGFATARSHVTYMTTFFMETLAERHRGRLSLMHVFPGLVMTPGFDHARLPAWFKLTWRWVVAPIVRPWLAVPPRECGERMLFLATPRFPARETGAPTEGGEGAAGTEGDAGVAVGTDGKRGGGAYAVDWDGEDIPTTEKAYGKVRGEGMARKVWEHTMGAFEEIEAGNVFTG